ncbi:hypothetical protein C7408_12252 [Paraburkholderia caballeronis]|nr:hypothetical protein C7408_12252 [Paraburkholderia caballeronis]TDV09973.1 hypothetical protein C7406_12452 [Paraburkholderia caballeronis]TDV21805.1 hypothetical protein C7404_12052 [Paraburkholderia caballeronis]
MQQRVHNVVAENKREYATVERIAMLSNGNALAAGLSRDSATICR